MYAGAKTMLSSQAELQMRVKFQDKAKDSITIRSEQPMKMMDYTHSHLSTSLPHHSNTPLCSESLSQLSFADKFDTMAMATVPITAAQVNQWNPQRMRQADLSALAQFYFLDLGLLHLCIPSVFPCIHKKTNSHKAEGTQSYCRKMRFHINSLRVPFKRCPTLQAL